MKPIRHLPWVLSLGLGLACWALACFAQAAPKALSAQQVRDTFVGQTITDGFHWNYHLKPDGGIDAFEMGRPRKGQWAIRGRQLCLNISMGQMPDQCYEVGRRGKAYVFMINGNAVLDVSVEARRAPQPSN